MEEIDFSSVPFINIDSEDFVGYWDSKPYTVKAGQVKYYPQFLALHLAKHLSDRILQKQAKSLSLKDNPERDSLVEQMLHPDVNEVAEAKQPLTKKAPVAKKKVEKVEEEKPFAELEAQPDPKKSK